MRVVHVVVSEEQSYVYAHGWIVDCHIPIEKSINHQEIMTDKYEKERQAAFRTIDSTYEYLTLDFLKILNMEQAIYQRYTDIRFIMRIPVSQGEAQSTQDFREIWVKSKECLQR